MPQFTWGGVNAQAVRADSVNEDATEQVEKKDEANVKAAEVKTTEQKQENNKTAVSATNENAKQNVAENTSDSKKVASNRDVNVIKNDVTTDEKQLLSLVFKQIKMLMRISSTLILFQ